MVPGAAAANGVPATLQAGVPQQQQQNLNVRSEAGLLTDVAYSDTEQQQQQQDSEDEGAAELQLGSLQPLAKLGTISGLLQQERARREAEAAAAALTASAAAAAAAAGRGTQDSFSGMPKLGQHMSPQQQQQQQQRGSIGGMSCKVTSSTALLPQQGLPPLPPAPPQSQQQQQQQQQRLVQVAPRVDSMGARALALHQLTCHMCHAWLLLYCCCFWMLLPSLLAWAKLPFGK
jgi:hypothetical protein